MAETKALVDRGYNHARKQAKLDAEEKEIQELEAQRNGKEPEVEEEVEEEVQEVEEVEEESEPTNAEERSFKKRYGDLRRHMQQKEKEWDEKFKTLTDRPAGILPPKSDEDLKAWADKYPDVASIVETIATKKAQEMFSKADTRFKELDEAQAETKRVRSENAIRKSHPDFDTLKDSDEFHDWAEEQPKWVQDALYENADDGPSVVRVIDLYKSDKGLTKVAKKEQVKQAAKATPRGTRSTIDPDEGAKKFRESEVSKMSDSEFEKNMDAILEAQRNGNFVYDVTGAAR